MKGTDPICVCWCSPHPNHYNNYLFQQIGSLPLIDLELVFFQKVLPKYPWKSDLDISLNTHFLQKWIGIDWLWLFRRVAFGNRRIYVIAGWNEPTMILMITCLAILKRPFILWSDTPRTDRSRNLRNWMRGIWLHFIINQCCYFFVTGEPGIKAAIKIGASERKLVNFPFATNTDYFKPASSDLVPNNHLIASGRLDIPHKGYDTALKALAICKEREPELSFKFTIAGTGRDEEKIRRLIQEFKLDGEVELKGWLEPSQLLSFYQNGSVLLHTANFDPFPNAVLEAMACGIPVIGSSSSGSAADRIHHGKNGFLFPPNDAEELAMLVIKYLQLSREEQIQLGKQARLTAEKWSIAYHLRVFTEKAFACAAI